MTTPALCFAVQRAYAVFGRYAAPKPPLNVCTHCCMPAELERQMRALPLRQIGQTHFYEYCTGAMGDLVQPPDEIKYLLPRWLELLANGAETNQSVELTLDRVGRCPPDTFSNEEIAVLDAFMLAYFDTCLNERLECSWRLFGRNDPIDLLLMADHGGIALAPLLRHWQRQTNTESTIRFVQSTYWGFWSEQTITNPFASDRPKMNAEFKAWMLAPATKAAFINKLYQPDFLARIDRVQSGTLVPFPAMVDAVLDHLQAR